MPGATNAFAGVGAALVASVRRLGVRREMASDEEVLKSRWITSRAGSHLATPSRQAGVQRPAPTIRRQTRPGQL
jgi:hypothetical protein